MLYKPTGAYRSSLGGKVTNETRDLSARIDTLEKELERKEWRNENLSKELQNLRTTYANQQREQRIVAGTFERLNTERTTLTNDLTKCRDHNVNLEMQLTRLSDSQQLLEHLGRQQQHIDGLQSQLDKSKVAMGEKEEIVKTLKRDVDALHRTLDVQMRYESPNNGGGTNTSNLNLSGIAINASTFVQIDREKMRSLYYELGKRQADAHSLALTLADSTSEVDELKQNLRDASTAKFQVDMELIACKDEIDKLEIGKKTLADQLAEIDERYSVILLCCLSIYFVGFHALLLYSPTIIPFSTYHVINDCFDDMMNRYTVTRDMNSKLTAQIEDLSKRLTELRTTSEAAVKDKDSVAFELSSMLYTSQMEVVSLKGRIDELQQTITQVQSVTQLAEHRTSSNIDKLTTERNALAELLGQAETLKPQVESLSQQLVQGEQSREELLQHLRISEDAARRDITREKNRVDEMNLLLDESRRELWASKEREKSLSDERADAMRTLEKTIDAAKSLSTKLQQEKDKRIAAEERAVHIERMVDNLQRSKEHVSSAVLDALHQEKTKNAR